MIAPEYQKGQDYQVKYKNFICELIFNNKIDLIILEQKHHQNTIESLISKDILIKDLKNIKTLEKKIFLDLF